MTQDEQQQVNAIVSDLGRKCGLIAIEGANTAGKLEAVAQENRQLQAEIARLNKLLKKRENAK